MSGSGKSSSRSKLPAGAPEAKPHYHGHRQRLRERLLQAGTDGVRDYELLELILFRAIPQRDVKPLAKNLIERFGSFAEAIAAPIERLREIKGLGEAAITELKVVQAAASQFARGQTRKRPALSSWSSVLDYCRTAHGVRRQGAVPHPVPRQAQPAHRRRGAWDRHRRSHAGLSARGGQARARTVRDRDHPGAQPSRPAIRRRRRPTSR